MVEDGWEAAMGAVVNTVVVVVAKTVAELALDIDTKLLWLGLLRRL
jgi:hypothetical protein